MYPYCRFSGINSRGRQTLPLLVMCILLLVSCSRHQEDEGKLIYAALNPLSPYLQSSIETHNQYHPEAQIEVRDYSDEAGLERLITELMLGQVPDIMEMQRFGYYEEYGRVPDISCSYHPKFTEALWYKTPFDADTSDVLYMPYQQLALRGYLEDLWPYIDNDPEFGRERILEKPLKAAEINGGLYMLPKSFSINTLMGSVSTVGERCGWTLEELMEAFSSMPEGSSVLRYDTIRQEVFFYLLAPLLDQFIDWETGECIFDNQDFRDMLDFLALIPETFDTWLKSYNLERERGALCLEGFQMLEPANVSGPKDFVLFDLRFGEETTCIGYPTADGSSGSSFIFHGPILAMSSVCRNKEAAWNFMRRQLRTESKSVAWMEQATDYGMTMIPLNQVGYKLYVMVSTSNRRTFYTYVYPGGPFAEIPKPTEETRQRFEDLVNNTTQLYWPDDNISAAVWDAIGPYFAGDKTMDETIALVQDRVRLYVNEQK